MLSEPTIAVREAATPNLTVSPIAQAWLGYPALIQYLGFDTETLRVPNDGLSTLTDALRLHESIGMTPDQINDSMLPLIDAMDHRPPDWEHVRQSLNAVAQNLTHGTIQDAWTERLGPFVNLTSTLTRHLSAGEVGECEGLVRDAIYQFKDTHPIHAAHAAVAWYEVEPYAHIPTEERPDNAPSFLRDLLYLLDRTEFDRLGLAIAEGELNEDGFREGAFSHIPDSVLNRMIECFEVTGYTRQSGKGVRLTQRGKDEMTLGYDELRSDLMAYDFISVPRTGTAISSFDDIKRLYAASDEAKQVKTVELTVDKPTNKVLYLSEILLGENTLDPVFLERVMSTIETMPDEMKPNTIVVSGLINGAYKYREKDSRAGLVKEQDTDNPLNTQLAGAKIILDRLAKTGATVIYNMSDRDRETCRDGTIDAMKMMMGRSKKISDWATYWQQDQMMQNPAWDKHRDFWTNVAFEYCLRSGRPLRSSEEMTKATHGKIRTDEYLVLFDIYQKALKGEPVPPEYEGAVELDNIPFPGREFDTWHFVDDVNIKTTISDSQTTRTIQEYIRHIFSFGTKPMYQVPGAAPEAAIQHYLSEDGHSVDRFVVQHQNEARVIGARDTDIILTPSFVDPDKKMQQKGSVAIAGQTPSWRQWTTRRRVSKPGALMFTDTLDYRTLIDIFNAKLMDKASISPQRETAAFLFDLQTGSVTSRPDYFISLLHMIGQKLQEGVPMHLFSGGDLIQGWNYKTFPIENAGIGLIPIDAQVEFVSQMLRFAFEDLPADAFRNLKDVHIVTGNHELNSGSALNGAHHTRYLDGVFKELYQRKLDMLDAPVWMNDTVMTANGELFKEWVTLAQLVGGYNLMVRHMPLERGAGKGGGGSPLDQAAQFLLGVEDLSTLVDFLVTGHWHQRQMGVFGNKVAITSPALAGESGYEFVRGYRPDKGAVFLNLGGGLPPTVEFLSEKTLQTHQIQDGWFSDAHLRKLGFENDAQFDPVRHGFVNRNVPHSALQQVLWRFIDDIVRAKATTTVLA